VADVAVVHLLDLADAKIEIIDLLIGEEAEVVGKRVQDLDLPKRGPGYVDLQSVSEGFPAAAAATSRNIALHENGLALEPRLAAARISEPSDKSFETYARAHAAITGPKLPESTNVHWNQGWFDAHLEYPIASERSDFSLELRLGLRRLKLFVSYLPPGGPARAYQLHGGAGRVALDPRWYQAAATFTASGFWHILGGLDHLLFLLCLVLPFRRLGWPLVAVITSFTVAHSITLIAAANGIEVSSHLVPEVSVHLLAATRTAHWLEYVDWADAILEEPMQVVDGSVVPPDRPGLGLVWSEEKLRRLEAL